MFEGFEEDRVDLGDASIFVRHGGDGPPVVLLHGHPRTSATWYQVAPRLVRRGFTVICPDLRGYGQSLGPAPTADHTAHSKRAAARDIVAVVRALGHRRFSLAGHDRGSYVALRLALDHPEAVSRLALLDCLPIWRTWSDDVRGHSIDSGHHMAEEAPEALAASLGDFFIPE
jgi:haloacetate dehalogenase